MFHGKSSAKVVAGGSIGQLTQVLTDNPDGNILDIISKPIQCRCAVWASATSQARIRFDFGGAVFENSDYHDGDSEWQDLELDVPVPSGATQVKVILETAASATAYFDHYYAAINPIAKQTIPAAFITGPDRVSQQISRASKDKWALIPEGADHRHLQWDALLSPRKRS